MSEDRPSNPEATVQDIPQQLDTELSDAPAPGFQIVDAVIAGRAALRRRRLMRSGGIVATTLAAALVAGGLSHSLSDDSPSGSPHGDVAAQPSDVDTPAEPGLGPWNVDEPLQRDAAGELHVHPDATVAKRLTTTFPTGMTAELFHVTFDTSADDVWAVVPQTGSITWAKGLPRGMSFKEWAQQVFMTDHPDDSWVRFDERGQLIALGDLRIVAQQGDPGFGENFAGPSDPTAIAEVVQDGITFFLAVRAFGGGTVEAIPSARTAEVATLDDFLQHARNQYATNAEGGSEGLR